MPSPLYITDPATGETTVTNPDGSTGPASFGDPLNMDLSVQDGRVRDNATGQIIGNLGQQGPTTVVPLQNGVVSLSSSVLASSANGPLPQTFLGRSTDVQRQVGGTIGTIDALGNEYTITVGGKNERDYGAFLAPLGRQKIAYDRPDGTTEFASIDGPLFSNSDVQSIPGLAAWRLATVREATEVSLRYWLHENAQDVLKQILDAGGIQGVGDTDNISGLVNYLAKIPTLSQLNFSNVYFLRPAEGA